MEPLIRRITCDSLGVDAAELGYEVSLADELAVDSLDLFEITLRVESELGISVPERQLETVRTYGDLVGLAARLVAERQQLPAWTEEATLVVSARALLVDESGKPVLVRAGPITPYDAELIVQDAIAMRRAVELRVIVPGHCTEAVVASTERLFSRLTALGIRVSVSSDDGTQRAPDEAAREVLPGDHPLAVAIEAVALAGELLHELQKERAVVALVAGRGRPARELDRQLARTGRALGDVRAFLASRDAHVADAPLVHLAAAVELLEQRRSLCATPAELGRDVGAVIGHYSRVNARLLDAIAALVVAAPQEELARSIVAYLAFACAKEEAGLEGAELAYALATESFDAGHELALKALMGAERSCLTLFTATAAPDIVAAYRDGTADPVFDDVEAFERAAFERGREGFRGEASAWLNAVTAKLERLKEIGDVQSRAIVARAAATA